MARSELETGQKRDESFERDAEVRASKKELATFRKFPLYQLATVSKTQGQNPGPQVPPPFDFGTSPFVLTEALLQELRNIDPELESLLRKYEELGAEIYGENSNFLQQRIPQIAQIV